MDEQSAKRKPFLLIFNTIIFLVGLYGLWTSFHPEWYRELLCIGVNILWLVLLLIGSIGVLRGNPRAKKLILLSYLLQIPQVVIGEQPYLLAYGLHFNFSFNTQFGSQPAYLGLNLIGIVAALIVEKSIKKDRAVSEAISV